MKSPTAASICFAAMLAVAVATLACENRPAPRNLSPGAGAGADANATAGPHSPDENAATPGTTSGENLPANAKRLTILYSSELTCWLQPCGCAGGQEGGLPRRATFIQQFDPARTLLFDAGDFTCFNLLNSPVHHIQARYHMQALASMGYAAFALGDKELITDAANLQKLIAETPSARVVCANLNAAATGEAIGLPSLVVERAGLKIGLTAVIWEQAAELINEQYGLGYAFADPMAALDAVLPGLIASTDIQILLAHTPENRARELAKKYPQVELIVFAGATETSARGYMLPQPGNPATGGAPYIARDGDRGRSQGVIELTLVPGENGHSIAAIDGKTVYLTGEYADDPAMKALLAGDYIRDLKAADRAAMNTTILPPPGEDALLGIDRCESCHASAVKSWEKTRHAKAYRTLQNLGEEFNPTCVGCHSLGYLNPDGGFMSSYQLRDSSTHRDVSCCNCHGNAMRHADDYEFGAANPAPVQFPKPDKELCITCHDAKHHPGFNFEEAVKIIRHSCQGR